VKIIFPLFASLLLISGCTSQLPNSRAKEGFHDPQVLQVALAAGNGDIAKIDALKAAGVNIDAPGDGGITPLLWALAQRNKAGFEELLKLGADPNHIEDHGAAVMTATPTIADTDFLKLALAHGGNPNLLISDGWPHTPLMAATIPGGLKNVKLLVEAGADVNYVEAVGKITPAISAAELNQYDIALYLLEHGADYAAKIPTYQGRVNGIVWCIENNNIDPNSPLYQWRQKVIDFLRSKGVTVNPKIP
jgi:ankyrin repeat protein